MKRIVICADNVKKNNYAIQKDVLSRKQLKSSQCTVQRTCLGDMALGGT
jgi:hypothetical protein